jgi:SNF2 family DNA or RNA helicase
LSIRLPLFSLIQASEGLGKTSITYAALKTLKAKGVFKGALVLAPLRPVYSVWPAEQEKWHEFADMRVGVMHGKDKDDVLNGGYDLYTMNFEGIEWLCDPAHPQRMKTLMKKVDVLVIDELSKFKNCTGKRFKLFKPYLHKFERRWGLTGSPASNGLMNLFGQCYVLDLGRALGSYITHYRNKYFYPSGFGGYSWSLQPGAEEQIYAAVRPLALRMDAEDYLEMPQVFPVKVYVDLPPAARKIYDKMEDELFAELEGDTFLASTASSARIKCEQIANGGLYKDTVDAETGLPVAGKREWVQVHKAKLDALEDLLDELQGQPALCGYHFEHDLESIIDRLGKDTPHLAVSPKVFDKLVKQWNRNELPYLFGHPASMGHGNNLQEGDACHIVWYHIHVDFELYDQFVRRLRRQGNKAKKLFIYHIVARDTVDEVKMVSLSSKDRTQRALLDALKAYKVDKLKRKVDDRK